MEKRKSTVIENISAAGALTDQLKKQIENCVEARELEDIYLPYKPKRRTRATVAKEAGLQPLADRMFDVQMVDPAQEAKKYLNDKKTWDNLNFEWQQKKHQADIDAADALLAKEEKYQEKLEKRIDELRKRGVEITDKIIDQEVAKLIKIEDDERDKQNTIALHEEMKAKKLGQYAPSKTTSRGGGGGAAKKAAAAKKKK